MALGQQRDDDVVDDLRPDLDGGRARSPRRARPSAPAAAISAPETAPAAPGGVAVGRHVAGAPDGKRRASTSVRIARATSPFVARGHVALAGRGDDRHLVVGGVEADARAADVVDDDRVDALAPQLVAAVVERAVAVLGREADEHLPRAARRPRARRARPAVALELDGELRRGRPS